ITLSFSLGACTSLWQAASSSNTRDGVSSSLVDYLYPKGEVPPPRTEDIPRLDLPLRAGIAFVPSAHRTNSGITEATKSELLNKVKAAFKDREYIEHIEVIPETYLRSSKGFEGMQQVARLYGVDVMALVSYDQVSIADDTKASVLYWTIVGAYFIEGTKNEVQTFVDTAVFDVPTRKLLFRAPGIDKRESRSTAIESSETLRQERANSFGSAMEEMTVSLSGELDVFEERLESEPQLAEVKWDESKGGGGSLHISLVVLLGLAGVTRRRAKTRARSPR
ncbi:MAG: rhombotarget lipoprotein, partial [Gammaproteobacteria bacterium]|nr:rhombotarget lipoprotein [Gammaproteobacteria bacterium]